MPSRASLAQGIDRATERYAAAAPDDWESLQALAVRRACTWRPRSAERHFEACLKGRPDDIRALRDYLAALLEAGELEPFLALLRTPPPSADSEPDTWFFRGVASEKAGDWKTAAAHFSKAIELNPFLAKGYYRLAVAEERLGLRNQAMIHRKKSKEINEARGQFPAAYSGYLTSPDSGGSGPATAARRLATICETLGWGGCCRLEPPGDLALAGTKMPAQDSAAQERRLAILTRRASEGSRS